MKSHQRPGTGSSKVKPFLKWPGGKRWLAPILAGIARITPGTTYFEPFVGAAATFFWLRPGKAKLSDINDELVTCLSEIRSRPQRVLAVLKSLANSAECFYQVRQWRPNRPFERAARMIYLSKTAWGGMYRVNRKGEFNAPYAHHRREVFDTEAILRASEALRSARIDCVDFEPAIAWAKSGDFIYADPPYATLVPEGHFCRYSAEPFSWKDQRRLASVLQTANKRGVTIVLSAPYESDVLRLYRGWAIGTVRRPKNVSLKPMRRARTTEALLTNVPELFSGVTDLRRVSL